MFSHSLYPKGQEQFTPDHSIDRSWQEIAETHSIQAGFVISVDFINQTLKVVSTYNIPKEPFNGTERPMLIKLIEDCFAKFPSPHVHACSHLEIATILPRLSQNISAINRAAFIPTTAYGFNYIFIGFFPLNSIEKKISKELSENVDRLLCFISNVVSGLIQTQRLRVTELFIKEIGHDIASSVQAIVAKLRTIRDGRITEPLSLKRKVIEIEQEINSAYGIADMLGLAIDNNYQMRSFTDFDIVKIIQEAQDILLAEAQEKNIKFELSNNFSGSMFLLGDERAIQQCFMQLLLNAIKYSFGGTSIKIAIVNRGDSVTVNIKNKGYELPKGDEAIEIWDFGIRGKKAKELHVNGSGIGLFTVRKIVLAHCGRVWTDSQGETTTFSVDIPKREKLKSDLGLLC